MSSIKIDGHYFSKNNDIIRREPSLVQNHYYLSKINNSVSYKKHLQSNLSDMANYFIIRTPRRIEDDENASKYGITHCEIEKEIYADKLPMQFTAISHLYFLPFDDYVNNTFNQSYPTMYLEIPNHVKYKIIDLQHSPNKVAGRTKIYSFLFAEPGHEELNKIVVDCVYIEFFTEFRNKELFITRS